MRLLLSIAVGTGLLLVLSDWAMTVPEPPAPFYRGMTISCRGWGAEWAEPGMTAAMERLHALGATWIAFHPYAWIDNDGGIRHRANVDDPTVLTPLREARRLGLRVLLKPHIGYWGSKFTWRGAIEFELESEWARFFSSYEEFIVTQARMAEAGGAAVFSVGTEYDATVHREQEWRRIIASVRKVYRGQLVYAANWDAYDRVPFWDALDFIGIQGYFPLAGRENPATEELRAGWKKVLAELEPFAARHGKKILFTELGYNRSSSAAMRPWEYDEGGAGAEALKLRCVEVALDVLEASSVIQGVFLWKWFPTDQPLSHNFFLQYEEMMAVLERAWQPVSGPS